MSETKVVRETVVWPDEDYVDWNDVYLLIERISGTDRWKALGQIMIHMNWGKPEPGSLTAAEAEERIRDCGIGYELCAEVAERPTVEGMTYIPDEGHRYCREYGEIVFREAWN